MSKRLTWAQRIKAAKKRGRFSPDDIMRTADYSTCALGEVVPRREERYRLPNRIFDRGYDFMRAVFEDDFDWARTLLAEIRREAMAYRARVRA